MAVNVQAAVRAQLLGVNLTGMVSKTTATVAGQAQTTTEFLVMPSELDENEPITVEPSMPGSISGVRRRSGMNWMDMIA